ncbi:M15 family metallopeptidase [Robertmurraya sp. FSL W8-0741]|uniref:M15 family metallopeptidase n=1 Tax=Robertmurraya sp. FSL W8-0741 TaxID=2954629 RepID=UPI000BA723AE|nr:peptidase M15 [Bacillus sp. 7504-2]
MKKNILTLYMLCSILLISGCSQFDALVNKIPFMNQSDGGHRVEENEEMAENAGEKKEEEEEEATTESLTLESQFFNEIKEVDGKLVIQNPLNIMALVNKEFALPDHYAPEDLVRPKVPFSFGDIDIEKSYMRKEAAEHLELLFKAAEKAKIEIFAVSGYRSYDRQADLFDIKANQVGEQAAATVVAIPGTSEHQTGLAMDISSRSINLELIEKFEETKEGKWLAENAHKFGFILRYPKGKEEITGYQYEPWHFRYVGIEVATAMFEKGLTLEEYFNLVEKI